MTHSIAAGLTGAIGMPIVEDTIAVHVRLLVGRMGLHICEHAQFAYGRIRMGEH